MQEQAEISTVRNGDASPITKLGQAQVPSDNHNHPDDNIEDKPARNDSIGDTVHISSDRSHPRDPSNFGTSDNGNLVYDPGGNSLNTEDSAQRDDDDNSGDISIIDNSSNRNRNNHTCKASDLGVNGNGKFVYDPGGHTPNSEDESGRVDSISISNKPRTADAHCSDDRNRDKALLTASDVDPIPLIDFARAIPALDVTSPRPTDNPPTILQANSKCVDAAQHPPPLQRLADPHDPDRTQAKASDINRIPQDSRFRNTDAVTSRKSKSNSYNAASFADITNTFNGNTKTPRHLRHHPHRHLSQGRYFSFFVCVFSSI